MPTADNPAPYRPAPAPYRPAAPAYHPKQEYKDEAPQPFEYKYGVQDSYTGTSFDKSEAQDAYGNLQGSYRVNLPDGRVQVVTYTADHEHGFVADVSYEGVAQYPEEPKGGYGQHHEPAYHPAPKYAPKPAPAYTN